MKMLSSRYVPIASTITKNHELPGVTASCAIMMSNHEPDMITKIVSIDGPMKSKCVRGSTSSEGATT